MIVKVHEHKVEIIKTPVNEQEVNVTKCTFEFDETIPNNYVKKAFFTLNGNAYEQTIVNNECDIPNEVLSKKGSIELGVVAYKVENEELIQRFNPSPDYFDSWTGSLKEADNTEPITPTDKEQIESAIAQLENDVEELDNTKQDTLVSGENIKTINNTSILGSGNINLNDTYYTKQEVYNKTEVDTIKTTIESEIPTKLSQLDNDEGYINKDVDDLTNYTKTSDLSEVATSGSYNDLEDTPNLSVYSLITETGAKIDLEINSSTYVLTAKLYDKNNNLLSTSAGIDLPLETMVVGASYDSETKEIILTLKNGQEVRFSVADLVSGLQTEITPSNKLASDLVDDTNQTHKFVSQSEKTQITTNATNIAGIKNGTTINSFSGVESALNTKEDKSNKVTSISSSSTDTQYPSAKCVYDSQSLQDNEISDLKSENDYLNSIINQLPKVSSQGTILTLNNTIAGRMNIELGTSELEQETTTGKNLLQNNLVSGSLNGINYVVNNDKSVTLKSGTASTVTWLMLNSNITLEAGTYTMSQTYTGNDIRMYSTGLGVYTLDGERTVTKTSSVSGDVSINIPNGTTISTPITIYPMIEKSNSASAYEPYTGGIPAPNPSYPMPIHTISGNNTIKVFKNLIDKDNPNLINNYALTVPSNNNGWVSENNDYIVYIPCKKSTQYKITKIQSDRLRISTTIDNPTTFPQTYDYYDYQDTTQANYTTNSTANYLCIFFRRFSDTLSMQEILNTLIVYEVNTMQEANINLGDIEYCEIGNYKDEFIRDNEGNWGIRKNIGKVVLDGSEDGGRATTITTGDNRFYVDIGSNIYSATASVIAPFYSNKFKAISRDNSYNKIQGIAPTDSGFNYKSLIIYCEATKNMTFTEFQNWLSSNNVTIYYPLATPTYTPIAGDLAEQLENIYQYLLSYKGQTNISQINNDLPFVISASALLDLNTLVGE